MVYTKKQQEMLTDMRDAIQHATQEMQWMGGTSPPEDQAHLLEAVSWLDAAAENGRDLASSLAREKKPVAPIGQAARKRFAETIRPGKKRKV